MSLPMLQLRPISTSHYYTSGDVTIQAGVAIAPGVLIQADPGSQIIIKTGVCIGIGAILHAQGGILDVGEGASIGAEVLLVGVVQIGSNACIGAASTILNWVVESGQIVPPGSLLGDTSRQPNPELRATDTVFYPPGESAQTPGSERSASVARSPIDSPRDSPNHNGNGSLNEAGSSPEINVYGQVYVNRLLVKMFPNRPGNDSSATETSSSLSVTSDPWED